jgi:predicted DNA-binding protein (MmcQ/YjbR family)
MNIEQIREYCLSKSGVSESLPFDDVTLVMKVGSKMFALIDMEGPFSTNLKCDPEEAIELRERYNSVIPGYHMNKKHWNTVMLDGSIPVKLLFEWIDHSYLLVLKSLKKAEQAKIH